MTVDISSEAFDWKAAWYALDEELRAQAERIKELEAENASLRAVLEGAEYREIDDIAKQDPDMCRMLGMAVASLTKSEIAKTRNEALREAIEDCAEADSHELTAYGASEIMGRITARMEGKAND